MPRSRRRAQPVCPVPDWLARFQPKLCPLDVGVRNLDDLMRWTVLAFFNSESLVIDDVFLYSVVHKSPHLPVWHEERPALRRLRIPNSECPMR